MARLLNNINQKTGNKTNKSNVILSILTFIALMIVLLNLGRSLVFPIPWIQKFENNGMAMQAKGNNGTVIIDQSFSRLSFLNKDGEITKVINGKGMALRRFYRQVIVEGETFYVLDYEIGSDIIYTKNEHIVAYDANGRVKNTLYSADYHKDGEKQKIYNGKVKKIMACKDGVLAFFWDAETKKIEIHQFKSNTQDDNIIDEISLLDQFGGLCHVDYDLSSKKFVGYSFSGLEIEHDTNGNRISLIGSEALEKVNNISAVDDYCRIFAQSSFDEKIPESASYSVIFVVKNLTFWIALLYLVILVFVKVIIYFKNLIKNDAGKKTLLIGFSFVIVLLIFGISTYYSNAIQQNSLNSRKAEISSITYTLSKDPDNKLSVVVEEALNNTQNYQELLDIERYFYNIGDHNSENNINISIHLYKLMDNNEVVPICTSLEIDDLVFPWASDQTALDKLDEQAIYHTSYIDASGECIASIVALKNKEGETVGYLETTSNTSVMIVGEFRRVMTLFVTLLTFVVGIVLFFVELMGIINAKKKRILLIKDGHPHPEIAHFRSLRLCIEFVLKFDSVLMILIAKDLLMQNGITNIALLVGLPATLMGIGMLIGQIISDFCLQRFYVKKIIIVATGLNAIVYVLTAFLILKGSFIGYCIGIFIANICFGVMAGPSLVMPFLSGDENMRFEMNNEKSMASISASVISVMLSGIVAQYFGNYAIYLFALLPLIGVLIISLKLLPKETYYGQLKSNVKTTKLGMMGYVKFLFSPMILILILVMIIPSDTVAGYKSFFFPLFSQEYGLTKDFISNLVVLANFTVFILNKPLTKLVKNTDYWFNSAFFLGVSGLIYMSFKVNNSIIWATIVIILTAISDKFITPNVNMLWPRQCMAKGLPPENFNSLFIYISNISSVIRPTIMGAFLVLGTPTSCIWLGITLLVCAILFALLTSNSAMRTYQEGK